MKISPIHTLLIANRGEIACRIIRTCRRMGIRTVAVFSDADRQMPHVKLADTAVHIGPAEARSSYLDMDRIIDAAKRTGADAVHPGYGFLSENAEFARRVTDAGLTWVGPHAEAIAGMGSKSQAKNIAAEHGIPVIPGYRGTDQSEITLCAEAEKIGFPLLLKAAAGGGGKGMRIVHGPDALKEQIAGAKREAAAAFGNDELLIEKYFPSARHIEIQIFGDKHGHAIHLLERECTIQRRYQKILEESPSPVLSDVLRGRMGDAAVRLAGALRYDNAGTVEFIYHEGAFYFLEVNTRLQVEHPVTESVTGLDLVEMQIRCAEGRPLPMTQADVRADGYALECRLYAEDPSNGFLPGSGTLAEWIPFEGEGIRYDRGVESGSEISIHYDPMIGKVTVHGPDRDTVIRRMIHALRKTVCTGLPTNQAFLVDILQRDSFRQGEYDTHYIEKTYPAGETAPAGEAGITRALLAAAVTKCLSGAGQRTLLRAVPFGWRNNFYQKQSLVFLYRGREHEVAYRFAENRFEMDCGGGTYTVRPLSDAGNRRVMEIDGIRETFHISVADDVYSVHHDLCPQVALTYRNPFPEPGLRDEKNGYISPMPASVVKICVQKGDAVKTGQPLMILSSMKMENTIAATEDGTIDEMYVTEGEHIEAGRLLLRFAGVLQ